MCQWAELVWGARAPRWRRRCSPRPTPRRGGGPAGDGEGLRDVLLFISFKISSQACGRPRRHAPALPSSALLELPQQRFRRRRFEQMPQVRYRTAAAGSVRVLASRAGLWAEIEVRWRRACQTAPLRLAAARCGAFGTARCLLHHRCRTGRGSPLLLHPS